MPKVQITVSIDSDEDGALAAVKRQCEAAGMAVTQSLESIGALIGEVDEEAFEKVKAIAGVDVERDQSRRYLNPPKRSPK